MTSISEDPTLPLDLDGTSNVLSNSSQYGHYDSPNNMTSSTVSSELEQPGTFPNLTSAGRMSPHRIRTMKDQEILLGEMKKENFGLKLRIYHLEEALNKKYGDSDSGWKLNIELQVQLENCKKELAEKDRLLMQAKSAIDHMTAQHEAAIRELKRTADEGPSQEMLEELERELAKKDQELRVKEEELQEARKEADITNDRLNELQAENDEMANALRDRDGELDHMYQELSDLQQALAQREAPKATPTLHSSAAQTTEPYPENVADLAELESVRDALAERERELGETRQALNERDRQLKEVELKLLSTTQEMAKNAGDYAERMREKEDELEQYKSRLRDGDDKLRQKEAELEECKRERDAERQHARELEAQVRKLQPLIQEKEREIQDLRDRLAEAERQRQDGDYDRDQELSDLRKKLSEARAKAREAEPELAARQREIKRLTDELDDKEEELRRLRSKVRELEDALSQSRMAAHTTNLERNEQGEALDRLQKELEALRRQLMRQHDGLQHDLEGALAAKDAIIDQLRQELADLRAKLSEAERKYHHLNTTTAAEIGVLKATVDDLRRQLEHLDKLLKAREEEVGSLRGEKAGLQREVDRLRRENRSLRDQLAALQEELARQAAGMEQAEEAIAELRKLLDGLQDQQPKTNAAELASLRGQLAALELALKGKEAELEGLLQTIALKDRTIQELQQELKRLRAERAAAEERAQLLEEEKAKLEIELLELQSQARIHHLSLSDLQDRLTRAYAEREETARKLRLAEEALKEKDRAYQDMEDMYKRLSEELQRLQQQLKDLNTSPTHVTITHHHEAPKPPPPKSPEPEAKDTSRNTTMFFGRGISDNLFLTILQRLQELYNEITAGRADSNVASSSLAVKLEHLTALQRQLEDSVKDSRGEESPEKPAPANTSYTTYYYMHGDEHGSGEEGEEGAQGSSTPRVTPVRRTTPQEQCNNEAEINTLRAELEEMNRWNEALQARLDETRKTRHVGVGMEKGGRASKHTQTINTEEGVSLEKYMELTREVDRLLEELGREREKSREEHRLQQEEIDDIQATLKGAEGQVMDLEERLKAAMLRDASTSTEHLEGVEQLARELEETREAMEKFRGQFEAALKNCAELRGQLDNAQASKAKLRGQVEGAHSTIAELRGQLEHSQGSNAELRGKLEHTQASNIELRGQLEHCQGSNAELRGRLERSQGSNIELRGQLEHVQGSNAELREKLRFENEENRRLKEEITNISISLVDQSTQKDGEGLTTSMPNLFTPEAKNMSDSWTSPPRSSLGERPDVRALRAKNEDITRLNAELQRKCQEQLFKTPPHSRPVSAGQTTSHWQAKLRGTEESLRSEMAEREQLLLSQLRDAEARFLEKEAEWQAKVAGLRQEGVELERQLAEAMKSKQSLRAELVLGTENIQAKDEEILNLTISLSRSREKTKILEERIDQLLTEKNAVIRELEERVEHLERELKLSRESAERLRRSLQTLEGVGQGGAEADMQAKVLTLHETLDQLSQQLSSSLDESQTLKQRHHVVDDRNTVLADQLKSCQEQVQTLQAELAIYQSLLKEARKPSASREAGAQTRPGAKGGGAQAGAAKEGLLDERTMRVLEEVAGLREQLDSSIRNNNTLAEQLRVRLDHSYSDGHVSLEEGVSHADKVTGTVHTKEKGSGTDHSHQRTMQTQYTVKANVTTSGFQTKPRAFSSPKLSPRPSHHQARDYTDAQTTPPRGGRSNLESSSTSSFFSSHGSSTRLQEGEGGSGTTRRRASPHRCTHFPSLSLLGFGGDFDTLESRLQMALNSSSLQGQDRTFLEELLLYLRQQRRQLDDSRRLLDKLEQEHEQLFQEDGGMGLSPHIPSGPSGDSATLPPSSSHFPPPPGGRTPHPSSSSVTHANTTFSYGTQTKPPNYGSSFGTQTASTDQTVAANGLRAPGSGTQTTTGTSYGTQTSGATGTRYGTRTDGATGTSYGTRTDGATGISSGTQTARAAGSSYGTQTAAATGTSYRLPSPRTGRRSRSPSLGTHARSTSTTVTSYKTHTSSQGTQAASSPRGVATVGVSVRNGPTVNGFGGATPPTSAAGSVDAAKVDLSSLYEQLLQTHSSLMEARTALNQQQTQQTQK